MASNKEFLGRGWTFPPQFNRAESRVEMTQGYEDIEKSLEVLLGTRKGERVLLPDYGCNLDEMVFEAFNESVKTYLADMVKSAILYHEPRIEPLQVIIDDSYITEGRLMIEIEFLVRATNSRFNKVYPFYLEEGTEIQM
ncbi:MAG TPA: GPW/gp25 family protein [Balneolaceae bacterium]|nr:GPW/gp25 family protein [Balneolaceae bacterium]